MIDAQPAGAPLKGVRLLVVEDDALVYMLFEDMLIEFGCEVVPATSMREAHNLASGATLDGALLDVNLRGQPSYPVADTLAKRRIPFAFVTGYGVTSIREGYGNRPILQKPFRESDLLRIISELLNQSAQ